MNDFPQIKWAEAPPAQEARLRRWLNEWTLHEELRQTPRPRPASNVSSGDRITEAKGAIAAFDQEDIVAGDVRLLSSLVLPDAEEPRYILVLDTWEPGLMLVAPFSRWGTAATTGELETGRECHPLRVLSLWNTHSAPLHLLCQSWWVDSFTTAECDDALAVFRHVMTGKALPTHLGERIGPPIMAAFDPRIVYQHEEAALFRPLAEAAEEQLNQSVTAANSNELALAASTEVSRPSAEDFLFGEHGARIKLSQQTGRRGVYRAKVLNDPSNELAGAEIISTDDETLATFKEGSGITKGVLVSDQFRATLNDLKLLRIRLPDGSILTQRTEN